MCPRYSLTDVGRTPSFPFQSRVNEKSVRYGAREAETLAERVLWRDSQGTRGSLEFFLCRRCQAVLMKIRRCDPRTLVAAPCENLFAQSGIFVSVKVWVWTVDRIFWISWFQSVLDSGCRMLLGRTVMSWRMRLSVRRLHNLIFLSQINVPLLKTDFQKPLK